MTKKEISDKIDKTKQDIETHIRKIYDECQRFHNYVNNDLEGLDKMLGTGNYKIEEKRCSMNASIREITLKISKLETKYDKELKPFLDSLRR